MDASRIATQGITAAFSRVDDAAVRVASMGAGPRDQDLPREDLPKEDLPDAARLDLSGAALDLIAGMVAVAADASVLRATDTMPRRLLNVRI